MSNTPDPTIHVCVRRRPYVSRSDGADPARLCTEAPPRHLHWRITCQRKKRSSGPVRTSVRGNRRRLKPGNSFAKRCTTFAKANTARGRRNKRSRSVSRRRVVPALGFHGAVKRPRSRRRRVRALAVPRSGAVGGRLRGDQRRLRKHCDAKDIRPHRHARLPGTLDQRLGNGPPLSGPPRRRKLLARKGRPSERPLHAKPLEHARGERNDLYDQRSRAAHFPRATPRCVVASSHRDNLWVPRSMTVLNDA